jgi:hypothetical protein
MKLALRRTDTPTLFGKLFNLATRWRLHTDYSHASNTILEDDSAWSTLRINSDGQFRVTNADLSKTYVRAIDTIAANQSALGVLFDLGGTQALRTVQVGAADSAGAGFRTLRVAN